MTLAEKAAERTERLAEYAAKLQAAAGDEPFPLTYAQAGSLLGATYQCGKQHIRKLMASGRLRQVGQQRLFGTYLYRWAPLEEKL